MRGPEGSSSLIAAFGSGYKTLLFLSLPDVVSLAHQFVTERPSVAQSSVEVTALTSLATFPAKK
ncbi:hypothetical protein EMIT0324P_40021 [Pseudomonas chlororaphis]